MKTYGFDRFPFIPWGRREFIEEWGPKIEQQRQLVEELAHHPQVTWIIPMCGLFQGEGLERAMRSLLLQSYPHWKAVLVSDGTRGRPPFGEEFGDKRFSFLELPEQSRTVLLNQALAQSNTEWVGILNPHEILGPSTLFEWARLVDPTKTEVFYFNEARVDRLGRRIFETFSKSEFSGFTLAHLNFVGGGWVTKKSVLQTLGGFFAQTQQAEEYGMLAKLCGNSIPFRHIPLYGLYRSRPFHWETLEPDTCQAILDTLPSKAFAKEGRAVPHFYKKKISVLICYRNRSDCTLRALQALRACHKQEDLELILIDNGSEPEETRKIEFAVQEWEVPFHRISDAGPFNFARLHNRGVTAATGDIIFFLNNDVFLDPSIELAEWAGWAEQAWVGTVGIHLRFPKGATQHGGLGATTGGAYRLARIGNSLGSPLDRKSREVFGNTFAAAMIRKQLYWDLGGMNSVEFPNGFGDVVLNFECRKRGFHNLYLGHFSGVHLESASRGKRYEFWEEARLERQYPELIEKMLHQDLGLNKTPEDGRFRSFVRDNLSHPFLRSPWTAAWRPLLKRLIPEGRSL